MSTGFDRVVALRAKLDADLVAEWKKNASLPQPVLPKGVKARFQDEMRQLEKMQAAGKKGTILINRVEQVQEERIKAYYRTASQLIAIRVAIIEWKRKSNSSPTEAEKEMMTQKFGAYEATERELQLQLSRLQKA